MPKTVKMEGSFEIRNAAGTIEAKKVTKVEQSFEEGTQHFPTKIAGLQSDVKISPDSIAQIRKLFLRTDQPVTVKISEVTDTGFSFGPGDGWLCSTNGITGVWITTGANETEVEAIFVGD